MAASSPAGGGGKNDGWNDPPLFTYNPTSQASSTRTRLNKRVGFPLSSPAKSPGQSGSTPNASGMLLNPQDGPPKLPPVHILPPTSSTLVHPPVPVVVPTLSPPVDQSGLPPSFASATRVPQRCETLPELLERLDLDSADTLRKYTKKILHEMVDQCQESIQGRSREDVQARLGLLDDQWRDEKLSEGAKVKLGCLACALKNKDLRHADSLHLALMVDHISEVSQWMVGIKRLINELKLSGNRPPPAAPKQSAFLASDSPALDSSAEAISSLSLAPKQQQQTPAAGESTEQDVCLDTEKFAGLKPVLMPEILVPDFTQEIVDQCVTESEKEAGESTAKADQHQGAGAGPETDAGNTQTGDDASDKS